MSSIDQPNNETTHDDPFGEPATVTAGEHDASIVCPAWCVHVGDHSLNENLDDRQHYSRFFHVPMSLGDAEKMFDGRYHLPVVKLYLSQQVREVEPRIHLGANDGPAIMLTLAEAATLSDALSAVRAKATP